MVNLNALLAEGQDEQVTVNQRALVEKILARYSGEHTVFRELLQNSDDAGATSVELHFRTTSGAAGLEDSQPTYSPESLPNLLTTKCATLMVRNDGFVFRQEDWQRLTEIASGNPDEQKIGAFGVGFYSLFSVTDGPVVLSGKKIIQFHWRGDQLHVKSATDESGLKNTSADGKPWTTFLMDLREPAPMPAPNDFARFLTSCLGFTQNLRSLSLYFDGHLLFRVQKTLAPARTLPLQHNLQATSPQKLLRMTGVEEAPFQLKAEVSNWMLRYTAKPKPTVASITSAAASSTTSFASKMLAAFSSRSTPSHQPSPVPTPPPQPSAATKDPFDYVCVLLFLRTVAASLAVSPSPHFANEMLRATKKALPSITKYSLVWTGKDEYDASHGGKTGVGTDDEDEASARKVFSGLLPADISSVQGRVAIGFATHQTSGFAGSVGARFISTVERESLDFQSKYVAQWNQELLWAGGVLARTVFEEEMEEIGRIWKRAGKELEKEQRENLEQRALHLIRFFTFYKSTPQEIVGGTQEESFFSSNSGTSITLLSTVGPTAAHKLRLPSPHLAGFIKSTPVVPPLVAEGAPRFLFVLRDKGFIRDISLEDIFVDLSSHSLTANEAAGCFKWWTSLASNPSYDPRLLTRLKDVAMLSVPDSSSPDGTRILPLGAFETYVNPKVVPVDMPLPEHTLPFELSRQLSHSDLGRVFGWKELSLLEWLNYLTSQSMTGKSASVDTNLLASPPFAEKVLAVFAKGWQQVPAVAQRNIVELTSKLAFVPTRNGLKQPNESYFPNVSLFEDVAVVTLPSGAAVKGNMERLLAALGVRRHVELQLVFTRLLGAGDWSHIQLVRYLISVRNTLTPAEQDRLRKTAFLPREGEGKVEQPPGSDGVKPKPKTVRYRTSELYEPTDVLRELGLPLVDWTESQARWRSTSDEAKFLYDLDLQRVPTVATVLEIAANPSDPVRQDKALRYFLDGCVTHSYSMSYSPSKHALPFVPAIAKDQEIRVKPTEVYSNPEAALLGFPVLAPRFAAEETRFGLRRDPPPKALVSALVSHPPSTVVEASKIFAYLSTQVSTFASADLDTLRWASIVPVRRPDGKSDVVPPLNLYFSTLDTSLPSGVKSLFATIPDFGPAARPFLVACGVKESPTTPEIATMLLADPARFYDLAGSSDRYLSVLRLVALNYTSLSSSLRSRMRLSAFFLGTKRIAVNGSSSGKGQTLLVQDDDDDEEGSDTTLVYQLARASDLAVNDEPAAFHVFQGDILACPQEDALEILAEQLGARRISKLVTENYHTSGEPDKSKRAQDLQRTVAERTSLFLSERRQQYGKGELKHDPDWVQKHLEVLEVRSIELVRTLKSPQGLKKHVAVASACAKTAPNGDITLYVSQTIEADYYEIAVAMCKLLLSKLRPNDALLLLTILQTTLKNLKRRGFNVDRIITARKAEREAAEQRAREERLQAQLKAQSTMHSKELESALAKLSSMFPDADTDFLRTLLQTQDPPHLDNAVNQLLASPQYPKKRPQASSADHPPPYSQSVSAQGHQHPHQAPSGGLFSSLRRQFGKTGETRSASPLPPPPSLSPPPTSPNPQAASQRPPGMTPQPQRPGATPTSTDAIRANLTRAIQASRPETASNVSNAVEKTDIKESEAYCDATAASNLSFVAEVGGMRFFASRDVPNPTTFVAEHHDALLRFVTQVIRPVGEVFRLDPRALHVFHDIEGPLVAFNRNGSLYLNFRFYQSWHDELVANGDLAEPLISTFHTIAHELSHNLVKPHDSQFSFYFSAMCEEHFLGMAKLLQTVAGGV
ncbi:ubiquitin system component Cue [Rhodotorula toruloides]|uniref:Ubiquitin system component Cue n=1 Tax=Rhodotorula toruloides TaxID=5286 RepID=A0A511K7K7_RHOTO|nr:ubiquitin system component Cue [Rhodotorula toruloides]